MNNVSSLLSSIGDVAGTEIQKNDKEGSSGGKKRICHLFKLCGNVKVLESLNGVEEVSDKILVSDSPVHYSDLNVRFCFESDHFSFFCLICL